MAKFIRKQKEEELVVQKPGAEVRTIDNFVQLKPKKNYVPKFNYGPATGKGASHYTYRLLKEHTTHDPLFYEDTRVIDAASHSKEHKLSGMLQCLHSPLAMIPYGVRKGSRNF